MAAKVARGPRATPAVPKVRRPQVRGFRARRHFLEDPATFPAWVRRAVREESERLARFFRPPLEGVR